MRIGDLQAFLNVHGQPPVAHPELPKHVSFGLVTAAPPACGPSIPTVEEVMQYVRGFRKAIISQPELALWSAKKRCQVATGKTGIIMGLQNSPSDISPENIGDYITDLSILGVRVMGLAYEGTNALASGFAAEGGLTALGRDFICACNDNNVVIDLSHLNLQSAEEALGLLDMHQVMVSHTGIYDRYPHPRNLPLYLLQQVVDRRGIVGLVGLTYYLHPEENGLDQMAAHLEAARVLGSGLCFGTDGIYQQLNQEEQKDLFTMLGEQVGEEAFKARLPEFPEELNTVAKEVPLDQMLMMAGYTTLSSYNIREGNALTFFTSAFWD